MNKVIGLLKKHKSVRTFTHDTVSDEMVAEIIEAAGCASTSNYIQAYSVIRVREKETRKQIAAIYSFFLS